jgi:hypothetical protein
VEVVLNQAVDSESVRFEIRCRGELATAGLLVFESDHDASGP